MLAAILPTIATHGTHPEPVTLEGSIVAVADATDITSGRGKISFAASSPSGGWHRCRCGNPRRTTVATA